MLGIFASGSSEDDLSYGARVEIIEGTEKDIFIARDINVIRSGPNTLNNVSRINSGASVTASQVSQDRIGQFY